MLGRPASASSCDSCTAIGKSCTIVCMSCGSSPLAVGGSSDSWNSNSAEPTRIVLPSTSVASSIFWPLTSVPLRLSASRMTQPSLRAGKRGVDARAKRVGQRNVAVGAAADERFAARVEREVRAGAVARQDRQIGVESAAGNSHDARSVKSPTNGTSVATTLRNTMLSGPFTGLFA